MTSPGKTHTVDELYQIVQEMRQILAAALEVGKRPDWETSYETRVEFERLVTKYFEMNAILHMAPAMRQLREILRQERLIEEGGA
jgi:hypothetical protein